MRQHYLRLLHPWYVVLAEVSKTGLSWRFVEIGKKAAISDAVSTAG